MKWTGTMCSHMPRAIMSALMVAAMVLASIPLSGCAGGLPTYPSMSDEAALRTIADRLDSVAAVSGTVDILLTDLKGGTVSLDGAFVAKPPTHARLRAWKFGSPVLDLTVLPEGVWAFAAEREGTSPGDMTRLPAAGVSRSIEVMAGKYFRNAKALPESTSETLIVAGTAMGRQSVMCEIDRATLTPRAFRHQQSSGSGMAADDADRSMRIELDRYEVVNGVAWATRIRIISHTGAVELRLNEVELNGVVEASAFVPPGRAARLP